jgi:hypothetical protein
VPLTRTRPGAAKLPATMATVIAADVAFRARRAQGSTPGKMFIEWKTRQRDAGFRAGSRFSAERLRAPDWRLPVGSRSELASSASSRER